MRAYLGRRENRGTGRASARAAVYRFDILAELRRVPGPTATPDVTNRMAAPQPRPRFTRHEASISQGERSPFDEACAPIGAPTMLLDPGLSPPSGPTPFSLAYKIRFVMQSNAREAMQCSVAIGARRVSGSYRDVATADCIDCSPTRPGHRVIAEMMCILDHAPERSSTTRFRTSSQRTARGQEAVEAADFLTRMCREPQVASRG